MRIVKGFFMIVGLLTCFIGVEPVQQFLISGRELLVTFIIKIFQTTISCFVLISFVSFSMRRVLGV